jgi:hypothetical protein
MAEISTNTAAVDNTKLVEAIKEMRKDFTPENQNKVINLALRSTFLVPAILEKNTELVADADNHVKFQDKQKAKFILINHKERGSYFPAFTDNEAVKTLKTDQKFVPFAMKFADIAALTEHTPNVNGFVIDPFGLNLPFTKEILESIKQTLMRVKKEKEAAAKAEEAKPDISVSTNE